MVVQNEKDFTFEPDKNKMRLSFLHKVHVHHHHSMIRKTCAEK